MAVPMRMVSEIRHGGKSCPEYTWSNPTGRGPDGTKREGGSQLNAALLVSCFLAPRLSFCVLQHCPHHDVLKP